MESKNLLTLAITLTVGIILAGSLLMPVISDATTTEKTFSNVGYYDMVYTSTDELNAFWDHTKPHEIIINGDAVSLPETVPSFNLTIIAGDDWVIRYAADNVSVWATSGGAIGANVANGTDLTITASGGSLTATNSATTPETKTLSYTSLYYVSKDGAYVMKDQATDAYVLKDSPIHGIGMTYLGAPISTTVQCIFDGSVEDGITGEVNRAGEGATITNIALASNEVSGYNDLYTVGNITATVTNSNGSVGVTYSVYIVPAEVTAELTQHLAPGEIAILNALPILIIVALVVMAAGALYLKRDD